MNKFGADEKTNKFDRVRSSLETSNKAVGSVWSATESKLMLLRHWTLFDSISNSNYMMSKLGLWDEKEKYKLKEFLAHLGISIEQSKQKFTYLNPALKKKLETEDLQKVCDRFNMSDMS